MYSARYEKLAYELQQLVRFERSIHLDAENDSPNALSYAQAVIGFAQIHSPSGYSRGHFLPALHQRHHGRPKGVMIPHRRLHLTLALRSLLATAADGPVQVYTPMYHAGGLTVFLTPLFAIGWQYRFA